MAGPKSDKSVDSVELEPLADDTPWSMSSSRRLFVDRRHAGARLAERLDAYSDRSPVVLGIPRGGVPVAAEVARHLGAPLDLVVARKIGAPGIDELAIGAVTSDGGLYLDQESIETLGVTRTYLERAIAEEVDDAARCEAALRGRRPQIPLRACTAIVVDDGLATGATMRAALRAVRAQHPVALIAAAPVGSYETCAALRAEPGLADDVVCLHEFHIFRAVGVYYQDFSQTSDDEVRRLLEAVNAPEGVRGASRRASS